MHLFPEQLTEKIGFERIRSAAQDYTRSAMARTKLARMMPYSEQTVIERQLAQTEEMMDLLQNDAAFPLNNLHDIRKQLQKTRAENRILPPSVLIEVLEVCITARR